MLHGVLGKICNLTTLKALLSTQCHLTTNNFNSKMPTTTNILHPVHATYLLTRVKYGTARNKFQCELIKPCRNGSSTARQGEVGWHGLAQDSVQCERISSWPTQVINITCFCWPHSKYILCSKTVLQIGYCSDRHNCDLCIVIM